MNTQTDRGAGVRQITAFPPREVEAPDELQVEGMGGVKHGETHDVGLLVHYVIQPQQWEVLDGERQKPKIHMSDFVDDELNLEQYCAQLSVMK